MKNVLQNQIIKMKKFIKVLEADIWGNGSFEETYEEQPCYDFEIYAHTCGDDETADEFAEWLEDNYHCSVSVDYLTFGCTPYCKVQNDLWEKWGRSC